MAFDYSDTSGVRPRTVATAVAELAEAVEFTKIRCVVDHDYERALILLQLQRDLEAAAKRYLGCLETGDGGPFDDLPLDDDRP